MPDLTLRQRRVTSAPHAAAIGALAQEMRVGRVSSLAGRALTVDKVDKQQLNMHDERDNPTECTRADASAKLQGKTKTKAK